MDQLADPFTALLPVARAEREHRCEHHPHVLRAGLEGVVDPLPEQREAEALSDTWSDVVPDFRVPM